METSGPDSWNLQAHPLPEDATGPIYIPLNLSDPGSPAGLPPPPRRPRLGGTHPEESIKANLKLSFSLHAAIAVLIILRSLVFPGEPKQYRPALRVDLVGLPDILKSDLSKISPSLPPQESAPAEEPAPSKPAATVEKTEEAQPDEMVLKKKTESITERNRKKIEQLVKEEKAEQDRERKMQAALARMKSLARVRSQVAGQDTRQESGVLIKGNQISKGTSLSGEASEKAELSYLDLVKSKLQETWELPVWLSRQNLSAKVEITIDNRGLVRTMRFLKPSGNMQFDEAVKRTIAQSQPFPRPPKDDENSLLVHGISLGFPL
ncbi:MAG: cell envelope integrity protein TolA [Bdellovibrionales bacterium]|nr:cell envelope integrity protein TolA [Bdellovibrionales bacterium]